MLFDGLTKGSPNMVKYEGQGRRGLGMVLLNYKTIKIKISRVTHTLP